jgi:hypothetical protein
MLEMGLPVGVGTDATRVASYDPWNALYWLTTGKTLGGLTLYPAANRVDRETALRLYTQANTWFSNEQDLKGQIQLGQYADLAVLSADYFEVDDEAIRQIEAQLTVVGGRIVYGSGDFSKLDPGIPPAMPDWSPVNFGSRYWKSATAQVTHAQIASCGCRSNCTVHGHAHGRALLPSVADSMQKSFWGALGCNCWAT